MWNLSLMTKEISSCCREDMHEPQDGLKELVAK